MEWIRGPLIGQGSTATVSLATALPSGEIFAVKSTKLSDSKFLKREQSFLSKLNCPHIVKYIGFDINSENNQPSFNLFMEYIPNGTLYDEIQRHGGKLQETMIRTYTWQILKGLEYLHTNGLVHCDIKSQNILIGNKEAKIADLGCTKFALEDLNKEEFSMLKFCGTPMLMSPEVVLRKEQGFAADIWALGCTVIEMATGSTPWLGITDLMSAFHKIGFSDNVPEFPNWLSKTAKHFLSSCLKRDPKERMTASELLKHPFFEELGCYSEHKEEITMRSPCSVLEKKFWDSFEVSSSYQNLNQEVSSSVSERIQRLIGGNTSSVLNVPNWTCDDNWITVRSNNMSSVLASESYTYLTIHEEEVGMSMFDGPLLWDNSIESLNGSSTEMSFEIAEQEIKCVQLNFCITLIKLYFYFSETIFSCQLYVVYSFNVYLMFSFQY